MAGKVNYNKLVNELQRTMALEESGAKRTNDTPKRHSGCEGHTCSPACGYHGYCDYEATRYYNTDQGKAESPVGKSERHNYYKRNMRLGYNSKDY